VKPEEMPGGIWVFQNTLAGRFAGGLLTSVERAEEWIKKNRLSGVLTLYPVDVGVYEWAIDQGLFTPKKPRGPVHRRIHHREPAASALRGRCEGVSTLGCVSVAR